MMRLKEAMGRAIVARDTAETVGQVGGAVVDPASRRIVDREAGVVKGDLPLLGGRILTDRGDLVGALDDLEFDESTGAVEALVAGEETIAATRLRSIGSYAVVVAAQDPG